VAAVALGGVITFDCGPDPITITLTETAKIVNDTGPEIVIDGGGKVTLSGGGNVRILYMNTCDRDQEWTTDHCDNQDHPRLTVQNLTFVDGDSTGQREVGGGGGAIFVRGGRFKVINSSFFSNRCERAATDLGGGAIRALSQFNGRPVYVVGCTFGEQGRGNACANGGALSSIGVSYTVVDSTFQFNQATGDGDNPLPPGAIGGGNGGAIDNDGNDYTLTVCGSTLTNNHANDGGGGIFFVSNNRTGHLVIHDSTLRDNVSDHFESPGYPGIFVLSADNNTPEIVNSTIE